MRSKVSEALKTALKAGEKQRASTLRMVNAAIQDRDIANRGTGKGPAGDDEILQILTKMVKQRQESAKAFEDGKRPELAAQENAEIAIISEFLPSQMDDSEAKAAIGQAIRDDRRDQRARHGQGDGRAQGEIPGPHGFRQGERLGQGTAAVSEELPMQKRPFGSAGDRGLGHRAGDMADRRPQRAGAIAALRRGIDLGMTHIDTAEMYGEAEPLVAEAIAGRRDEVFLVSKVLPSNASRAGTIKACERSLSRLETDRLDCYLLHWRGSYPLEETFAAFEELRQAGKILSWGVSNFDVDDLEEALDIVGRRRASPATRCSIISQERAIEHAVMPWCEKHGVAVVAYSPFGQGRFPSPSSAGGRVLQEIADAHGATPRRWRSPS